MKAPFRQVRLAACVDSARLSLSFSHAPSAKVWSRMNHSAGEWIGEVKKVIAGMKDPFDLSFEHARRLHRKASQLPRGTRALLVRLLTSPPG
jgi:hypothetical protein